MHGHTIKYKNSHFRVTAEPYPWRPTSCHLTIEDVDPEGKLIIPGELNSLPVTALNGNDPKCLRRIISLWLPNTLKKIKIPCSCLPKLEEIHLEEGSSLTTDGKRMIFKGDTLLICFGASPEEVIDVPDQVHALGPSAFYQIRCRQIRFPRVPIRYEDTSFHGASFLQGGLEEDFYIGTTLYQTADSTLDLDLPPWASGLDSHALQQTKARTLRASFFPSIGLEGFRGRYILTDPKAKIPLEKLLGKFSGPCAIEVPEDHESLLSVDGVLFTKDRQILLYYPPEKSEETYHIPPGTRMIGPQAFCHQKHLKKVFFPEGVRSVGGEAFAGCNRLQEVYLNDDLPSLPGAQSNYRGLFSGCPLSFVHLPKQLLFIGAYSFPDLAVKELQLPEGLLFLECNALYQNNPKDSPVLSLPRSLREVGQGALWGFRRLEVFRGTAKGLIDSLSPASWEEYPRPKVVQILVKEEQKDKQTLLAVRPAISHSPILDQISRGWDTGLLSPSFHSLVLSHLGSAQEKGQYAIKLLSLTKEKEIEDLCRTYLKKSSSRIMKECLEEDDFSGFCFLLKENLVTDRTRKQLLDLANEEEKPAFAAVLLDTEKTEGSSKKRVFPL